MVYFMCSKYVFLRFKFVDWLSETFVYILSIDNRKDAGLCNGATFLILWVANCFSGAWDAIGMQREYL